MKGVTVPLTTILAIALSLNLAAAQRSDPVSVLKSLFDARDSANSDAALALFAEDGVVINVVGKPASR